MMFFLSSRGRHTRYWHDWSSDVCSSDLVGIAFGLDATDAIATMRASAIAAGRVVDDVAADIVAGRLLPGDLQAAPDRDGHGGGGLRSGPCSGWPASAGG